MNMESEELTPVDPGSQHSPFHLDSVLRQAWNTFIEYPLALILGLIICALISMISLGLAAPAMWLGYTKMTLKAVRGEPVEIGDVFSGMSQFLHAFVLGFLVFMGVCLGLIFLIVPGLFLMVIWDWAFLAMSDGSPSVGDSFSRSYTISVSDFGAVVILLVVCAAIEFAGSLVPLGGFVTAPLAACMSAVAYDRWQKQNVAG